MEHFLEGSPPIRLWYVNKDEKFGVFVWLLIWVNVPMSSQRNSMKKNENAPAK